MKLFFIGILLFIAIGSFGFIDPNLILTKNTFINSCITPLFQMVYGQRMLTAGIFTVCLGALFFLYILFLKYTDRIFPSITVLKKHVFIICGVLVFSYPMLSYDLFNYMATAKVTYTYKENPYVVMPIEIPNDPNLSFTRAANKLALYGPTWIFLTAVPHALGMGNIWQTIIAFKLINAIFYLCFCYLIWRVTKNIRNVVFFSCNPLVLLEVLVSGHNDIVMILFAIGGILLWQKKQLSSRLIGLFFFCLSFFVKGATVVFLPLLFFRKLTIERLMFIASCFLFVVFITIAPLREELYPWYAVWFIMTASFLSSQKYQWVWGFIIALSIGLELRHVPYMAMGYYEGPGPMLRIAATILPVSIWGIWMLWKNKRKICGIVKKE